jgi:uncharacterized membrane-anchored protein
MSAFITALAAFSQRIPKVALFGAVLVVQVALLAMMVIDRMQILRDGAEVTLQTRPIDPRDIFRGDYVVLGYDISEVPAALLKDKPSGSKRSVEVFVKLAPNREGVYQAVSAHLDRAAVKSPEVLIRGRIPWYCNAAHCTSLPIRYNLEKYFVPEGEGRQLEEFRNQRKMTVVAAVLPSGRAAIKRLLVDGKPVYDEPWFR